MRDKQNKNKYLNLKKLYGGGCTVYDNDHMGHLKQYIPDCNDIFIDFLKKWNNDGNNVCLDTGERQTDTIYLSIGSSHDNKNHVHIYDIKGNIVILKNKVTKKIYEEFVFNEMMNDYLVYYIKNIILGIYI